jgi:uncharacterized protein YjeT (DUF2065 family)
MLSPLQIETAVSQAIITASQRDALLALAANSQAVEDVPDTPDEQLRLIGGGNDIFVTIGILLLMAGGSFALGPLLSGQTGVMAGIAAVVILAIAEIVTRQRRMRLSSTVLALLFMACVATFVWLGASSQIDLSVLQGNPLAIFSLRGTAGWISLGATVAFVTAAAGYFYRFRVPVLAAVIALALTAYAFIQTGLFLYDGVTTGTVQVPTAEQLPDVLRTALFVPLVCGLIVFGIAVALDLRDRERRTVWSDCAFWLHVVSAPMLVHPLFVMATGQNIAGAEIAAGSDAIIGLTVLILVFTFVALAIDRRSLLVPTLGYFGALGVQSLVSDVATNAGIPPVALVLISVGALVIMFGAGWQRIRHIVVGTVLPDALLRRLPPIQL